MTVTIGSIWNYGGDNYKVTRVDPDHFLVQRDSEEWCPAVELTDHVGEGETATVTYVLPLDDFEENYSEGETEEGAEASQLPADTLPPPIASQQPAGGYEKVKPGEPNQPEAQPKK